MSETHLDPAMQHIAERALSQSHHDLATPLQAILLNQQNMASDLNDLSRAVLGDEKYQQVGLIARIVILEAKVSNLESWRLAIVGGGGAIVVLWNIFKHFWRP